MYNQQHDNKDNELVNGPTYPAVNHPPVGLHEYGRSKVLLWVPPVGRARRAATETQDTLVETIQLLAILNGLKEFPVTQ